MEYLINVALGFVPSAIIILLVYVVLCEIMKRQEYFKGRKMYKEYRPYLFAGLALSLVIHAMNPAITYKHQTFDQVREEQKVEQLNTAKHSKGDELVIKDDAKPIVGVPDGEFDNLVEFNNDGRDE
jgi:hypothetical protein